MSPQVLRQCHFTHPFARDEQQSTTYGLPWHTIVNTRSLNTKCSQSQLNARFASTELEFHISVPKTTSYHTSPQNAPLPSINSTQNPHTPCPMHINTKHTHTDTNKYTNNYVDSRPQTALACSEHPHIAQHARSRYFQTLLQERRSRRDLSSLVARKAMCWAWRRTMGR